LALLLSVLTATSLSTSAQEVRDRQLIPVFDFATIQMPVEIVSIKLNDKEIRPDEKIKGNDEWLRGVSFTLKNISDQPIAYVNIGFKFPLPNGFVVYSLPYGINLSRGDIMRESSPPAIQPGHSLDLVLTNESYKSFLYVLAQAGASSSFDTAAYYVDTVCFENQSEVIWQGGFLKRRHPTEIGRFDPMGRYVLPTSQR
ncbi:MAG TPA: hypothetical protein VKA97_08100, partial [Pyrinomonadaceae bacterium]|nr:hypothetical protein [Pyrinomonadaceae bacterium]